MEIDTGTNELLCSVTDGVALITLNRPEARNAMSPDLTAALRTQIKERAEDDSVGALLITGAGTAFCSGGDVKGMGGRAGLAIALACDMRIAARSAFAATGYARIGLSGDYGMSWLLTRTIGAMRARELMLTAERVDAERCERIGLVNRIVDDAKLQDEAFALARSLAAGPRIAFRHMKDNLDDALGIDYPTAMHREAERLTQCSRTADHKEAVTAFVEKRKPVFTGR
jgi:enoyl-CoA hydratase/carnithine racemase